ncbi:MAG TPA: Clp protease N-terminal domain-containing protein, partial [Myxococcaceae bacterium]|nr:Clp protease N-terminal domain-containing protein [Myxococcaceae bacterium]
MVDSTDLAQVLHEADDIARSVAQKLTSAHVLLALFTVENRAQLLLKEKGVDEDRLLEAMTSAPVEPDGLVRELNARARELAGRCGASETDCLHLLVAFTRVRCAASDLLSQAGIHVLTLGTTALSYCKGGSTPRRLQPGRT